MAAPRRLPTTLLAGLLYPAGDTVAALLLHQFSWTRLLGMALLGTLLYAREIPAYFRWIDRRMPAEKGFSGRLLRAGMALAYFNPLWIARHFLLIQLFGGHFEAIGWGLLAAALRSFAINAPVSLIANYLLQNHVSARWRFVASSVFSGLMAIYYALSA